MNEHLSPDQISQWMAGQSSPHVLEHGHECPECAAELARLRDLLALFRGSVVQWTAESQAARKPEPARRRLRVQPLRWAVSAALLLVVAAIPVYRQRQSDRAKADELLLEQVDAEVSRTVPSPMEPLTKLIAWQEVDR